MMDVSASALNAIVKLAIASALFITCRLVLPVLQLLIQSYHLHRVVALIGFRSSVNPATLASALYHVRHVWKFFYLPSKLGHETFDSLVIPVHAISLFQFSYFIYSSPSLWSVCPFECGKVLLSCCFPLLLFSLLVSSCFFPFCYSFLVIQSSVLFLFFLIVFWSSVSLWFVTSLLILLLY